MKRRNLYWLFSVVVTVFAVFGIYEFYNARAYRQGLEDSYNRAFFELTDYVDDIDTLLAKSMLATSASEMASLSQELSVQATAAKTCLAQLPITEVSLDKTEKFLAQVGDYTYTLSQNIINKKAISEDEYESLSALGTYAASLNSALSDVSQKVYRGELHFGRNSRVGKGGIAYAADGDPFSTIEKKIGEYPTLIYDGPFSEHIENMKPKLLENKSDISQEAAAKKVAEFLGMDAANLEFMGETQNSNLPVYRFSGLRGKTEISASVSKQGGYMVYFLGTRRLRPEKLTVSDAIAKAKAFLSEKGLNNMKESYYEKKDGVATVNFAYQQNNVICYSDLIKVKVALDDGEIIGMEAYGYVMNHHTRDIRTPALAKQDARDKVSSRLAIDSVNIALIPKDSKREVLCYEFKGTFADKNFLIYLNAETGAEEDIQILIESPDGILTI